MTTRTLAGLNRGRWAACLLAGAVALGLAGGAALRGQETPAEPASNEEVHAAEIKVKRAEVQLLKAQIELLLNSLRDYEFEQRFFIGEGKGMRVTIESKWLGADWQWFVGVLRGAWGWTRWQPPVSG